VESDHFGSLTLREVTAHGISDLGVQLWDGIRFVKMDAPRARAVKPPSGASSTTKISSSMARCLPRQEHE